MLTKIKNSILSASIIALAAALCHAAEPLCWERTPNRPAPAQFDTYHGETLDFRCTFTGFGAPPFGQSSNAPRLYYQTNGMGGAWWSLPATISSNMLAASFPPSADPGAERLTVFFGAPSNAYAAAQVRFRNSPGASPNDLAPPAVLDWQAELSAATNALWESSAAHWQEIDLRFETTPTFDDISAFEDKILDVSRGLETNVAHIVSNVVTKSYVEDLGISGGGGGGGLTTNDVFAIVTNTLTLTAPLRLDGLWLAEGAAGDYQTEAAVIDQSANTVSWKVLDSPDGWFVTWNYAAGTLFDPATDTYSYGVNEMPLGGYWVESDWVADYVDVGPISYTSSTQTVSVTRNALGLARLEDLPSTNGLARLSDLATATNALDKSLAPTITNIAFAVSSDATNALDKSLAPTITNIASTVSSNAIANADTTYRRTIGITNINQTVQYVSVTDNVPSTLEIQIPTNGATKDWMVYVTSVTNVSLVLPSATWWMADAASTNDIAPATPTAFWFSQITDGVFILGRQELTEVTLP